MTNIQKSIIRLRNLATTDTGSSEAARSVLVYAWNVGHPIRAFYKLDELNRNAALQIITASPFDDRIIESLVPEIRDWARAEEGN